MNKLNRLRKSIYESYAKSLKLDAEACYIDGTPLRPVVPLDTARESLFIVGAYPSARFHRIRDITKVPAGDNLGPFEPQRWFDASCVTNQLSAKELDTWYLEPMGVKREDCWITNLVKVFLFKPGHRRKYEKLSAVPPVGYESERFHELAVCSKSVLEEELQLAKPRLVVTLGEKVAGVLHGVQSSTVQRRRLSPTVEELRVGKSTVPMMHCAHPGILMRNVDWCARHDTEFIPALQKVWRDIRDDYGTNE